MNMEDLYSNDKFMSFLPTEKCLAHVLINSIAVDEGTGLDESQYPHQITGLCCHTKDPSLLDFNSAIRIQDELEAGQVHFVKEIDTFCIGLNHGTFTSLIPVCLSPTCKKDDITEESTSTVQDIFNTIKKKYVDMGLYERWLLSTVNSD